MAYFNIFSIPNLISAISCLAIGIFVLSKNFKGKINQVFFFQTLTACIWQLGTFLVLQSDTEHSVLIGSRFTYVGAIFIPVATFHLISKFLDREYFKKYIIFGYLICFIFFLPLSQTRYFIAGFYKYHWGFWYKAGSLHFIYLIFFAFYMLYPLISLYKSIRKEKTRLDKMRAIYLLTASVIGYIGAIDFLPDYRINIYPSGSVFVFFYILIVGHAIVKYQLMEIGIIIKKAVIFGGLFTSIFMIFVLLFVFGQSFLYELLGGSGIGRWISMCITIFIITFSSRRIEYFLTRVTDKYLFQKKYDYQRILKEASEGMTLVTDMKKLLNLIVRVVSKSIRVKSAAIFQLDDTKDKYVLKIKRGVVRKHSGYSLDKDSALVSWLKEHRDAILTDEIEGWLRSERFLVKEKGLREALVSIKDELSSLSAAVCVPSFSKGKLIGFLALGEKLSGDIYTQEDMQLLCTLSSEVAIAVENAKNFMEVEKLREKERESYIQTVLALAQTVDEKDSYTHGHLEDVAYYGMQVAEELKKSSEFKVNINKDDLETALRLHDIGKIGVPDIILNKNGKLTPQEWQVMKQHCEIGARIVEPLEKLRNVGRIIKHHQEKYDGTGYPDGLKAEEIPLESRIISVVDAYHAMISDRPYRKALPQEAALQELKNNIGIQFDPIVVGAFVRAWENGKIKKI